MICSASSAYNRTIKIKHLDFSPMPSYTFIRFSDLPVKVVCQHIRSGYYNDPITFRVTVGLNGMTTGVRTSPSPVSMAALSFFFHCSATSFARGSSGLGALNNAWIDSNTVRICRAGDHLSGRREDQQKQEGGWMNTNLEMLSYLSKCLNIFFPVCQRWGGRFWS